MNIYDYEPYFDDFDPSKNYHQIMFKPGRYAVQARELNQLQTILRDQIEKFGNHIFKNGSVVIPGNSVSDLNVPYIIINNEYNSVNIQSESLLNKIIENPLTGVEALVREITVKPDSYILYLNYVKGGGENSPNTFSESEVIRVKDNITVEADLLSSNATGYASLAFINRGVYYVNGTFVEVLPQTVVMSENTRTPSCHVLLKINEEIITSDQDQTLLDNAQGSYNFAAPGADRVKISLELTTLPLGSPITDDYVEIMRYNNGVLEEHSKTPRYSELEKSLARRTFDESGNYLVEGFAGKLREHLKTKYNDGYLIDGDRNKFVVEISPGRGYIEGLLSEFIYTKRLVLDKARTADHIKSKEVTIENDYGRYIYVTDLKGLPDFTTREIINLYDDNDPLNGSATKIGEARAVSLDFFLGDPETDTAIYKLFFHALDLDAGKTLENVGGIRFGSGNSATVLVRYNVPNATFDFVPGEIVTSNTTDATATVERYTRANGHLYVYKHDHTKNIPKLGDTITGNSSESPSATISNVEAVAGVNLPPIFEIPVYPLNNLKNESNLFDIEYTTWKRVAITTDTNGDGSYTLSSGTIVPVEAGTTVAVTSSGIVTRDKLSVVGNNQLVVTGASPSDVVYVIFQVNKTASQPKIKTLTQLTLTGVNPSTTISLGKADIVRVIQITTASGEDVTSRYTLDNGQRDYAYFNGTLNLTGTLPVGDLTITFEYFAHSGSGDYFSVDSYSTLGDDYVVRVPSYRSTNSSQIYNLGQCLDFRPTVGSTNVFNSGGAQTIDIPVQDTFTVTSVQYFVPRVDIVALGKRGELKYLRGAPKENPKASDIPDSTIGICVMFIPAYTASIANINLWSLNNYRYTMRDIKSLDDRIENVEYVSLLNSSEFAAVNGADVTDPLTGIARFKTGYLVDTFRDTIEICDFFNSDNSCRIYDNEMGPSQDVFECEFDIINNSSHYQDTSGQITLPYTETPLITQDTSTRVSNLNPFMVINWEGVMTIDPPFDTWIDVENLDTIYESVEKTVNVTKTVNRPCPVYYSPPSYSPSPSPSRSPTYAESRPDVVAAVNSYLRGDTSSDGAAYIASLAGSRGTTVTYGGLIAAHYMAIGQKESGSYSRYF